MVGVTVQLMGTQKSTSTDIDGKFSIQAKEGDKLKFSYIGMTAMEKRVSGSAAMNVVMQESNKELEEVVVVGYGTQKKVSVTGSIVAVDGKKLESLPTDNLSNMLAGRLPGLIAMQHNGMPGEGSTILVRGSSTTSSGGNAPIYIVDGIQRDMIDTLSPDEIANITVLKDAASAAIYGVQGGSGVVLITTKQGLEGKPRITFKASVSSSKNTQFPEFLNALDYMNWHNKARELDGLTPLYTDDIMLQVKNHENGYGETDWFGEVFSGKGISQDYNITTSGGSKNLKYFVSGGYNKNDGSVKNLSYQKYFLRSNLDFRLTDWLKMNVSASGYRTESDRPASDVSSGNSGSSTSVFWQATLSKPIFPVMYGDKYSVPITLKGNMNPIAALTESGYNRSRTHWLSSSVKFDINIPQVKGLTAYVLLGYDYKTTRGKIWKLPYTLSKFSNGSYTEVINGVQQRSALTESHSDYEKLGFQPSIQYENTFNDVHYLRAQVVYDQLQTWSTSLQAGKMNFDMLDIPELSLGSDEEIIAGSVKGSKTMFARKGVLTRLNYAYDNKYLIEALVRADASVKFANDNRWGYFPAVSLGWRLSEESFMENTRDWLTNLKLRASFGITGNDRISDWLYMRSIALSKNAYVINGQLGNALVTGSVPSYDISWEKQRTTNVGFDMQLFNGKLYTEFDYYYKYSWDILQSLSASMPPSLGGNYPSIINKGKVDNRGFELILGHRNKVGKDFSYDVSANIAYNKNRILQFNDAVNIPDYQKKTGHCIGSIVGLVADGLYKDEADLANSPKYRGDAKVGDIKYKDLNGDGVIDLVNDATIISDGTVPKWNYALNMNAQYKWVDLTLFFQGAADYEIALQGFYGSGAQSTTNFTKPFAADGNTPYFLVENSWTPENPNAEFPRLTTRTAINQNAVSSTFWLRKGNYIRLKNLQLGVNIPKDIVSKAKIEALRVYFSASNVFTLSKLNKYGFDPEAPTVNNGYYPQQRVLSFGINLTL
ncbi:MAG: TonB-dependent receptor [Bacteroidales bacterium]|nr:TonB-dependent receptor [Candidatus Sodaliphilus fimicaballi]